MKQVIIKRLTLANFKGARNVAIDFHDGVTTISGKNGTGKTTIKDAFTWLLWGKDSEGNSDTKFGIKTNDVYGNFIPDLEHEVTGTFQITDTETGETETVELRRVFVEEWQIKKGETERRLKGHRTDYFYNGVPLKTKGEYDERINAIIPEDLFKIIADPAYFLTLNWKAQRGVLLEIAGGVSYEDVAKKNAKFTALIKQLTGKSLEDFKRETAAKRLKVEEQINKIPTRIDEITRATPIEPDYKADEAEKEHLEAEYKQLDEAATSVAEANRIAYNKATEIQAKINEKKAQQQSAIYEAQEAARNEAYKKNETYNQASRELQRIEAEERDENNRHERERAALVREQEHYKKQKDEAESKMNTLREKWYEINGKEYTEDGNACVCPLFKHICQDPEAQQRRQSNADAAKEAFYEHKQKELERINEEGSGYKAKIATLDGEINRINEAIKTALESHGTAIQKLAAQKEAAKRTMSENPPVSTTVTINPETLPKWVELQKEIDAFSAELATATTGSDDTGQAESIRARKAQIMGRLDEVKRRLNLRPIIEANKKRIDELKAEAAALAQEKANLQSTELAIEELDRERMDEVERRVNGLFSRVQFRMFKQLVNGGKEPDCLCYIDGVKYEDKNAAGQVNAGLDVINTLCKFHRVTAPIFVDNAESINAFIPTESQLVKLVVVSDGEGLIIS